MKILSIVSYSIPSANIKIKYNSVILHTRLQYEFDVYPEE